MSAAQSAKIVALKFVLFLVILLAEGFGVYYLVVDAFWRAVWLTGIAGITGFVFGVV